MAITRIHYLPFMTFVLIPCAFIITYCIAIYLEHVEVEFPYISDTGTTSPESCIFSQLINLVAALMAATMYVRYKLVEQHCRDHLSTECRTVVKVNLVSIIIGMIGCFGVSLLANFQETNVIVVHMTGALVAFGCATIYSWLQTFISYKVSPLLSSMAVVKSRLILSIVVTLACVTTIIPGFIAHSKFHGELPTKWRPEDGGYVEHVISTGSEWLLVLAFDFFILTLTFEMKTIAVASPQILFIIEDQELDASDLYNSDRLNITRSQSSVKVNSPPTTPYGVSFGSDSNMMTHAIIH